MGRSAMKRGVDKRELTEIVKDIPRCLGVCAVGIATKETLAGGPPSTDLTYVLPEAQSAICFAFPMDQSCIEPFLKKEDFRSLNLDNIRVNTLASGAAFEISNFLNQLGYPSVPQAANLFYRTDTPNGPLDELPPIAHRYLAVRSGIGHFGLSGNVIRKEEGAAIIFGSVVTAAELIPTEPLPEEENYCDSCRLCMAACASGFMDPDEKTTVTMGGVDFSYAKRRHHNRCDYVCGGFTGLHSSGKWSTWSPGRFSIPERDEDFLPALIKALKPYLRRPAPDRMIYNVLVPGYKIELTCCHCQLICHPDKEVRKRRYKMITESGVIVQDEKGVRIAVSPEEAEKRLAAMDPEMRALFEEV
jgi:epoxyqueuosine reductase